ncbi:Rrf2 family transcriptional regulator [Candidatus Parcubacteria bacterium]|nr:Rrf2 family transcriptional regulator [Candidatus Parcubacteria bacterium]
MKFSTRTTYGLRALIKLSEKFGKNNVSLASISRDEHISLKYLEQIFSSLKKANLVKSEKGATGGYSLVKKPEEITIFEIIEILEKDMNLFRCIDQHGKVNCNFKCNCGATKVLINVQRAINDTLKGMSLKDLI